MKLARDADAAIQNGTINPAIYIVPNGGAMIWYDMLEMKNGTGESVPVNEDRPPHSPTPFHA